MIENLYTPKSIRTVTGRYVNVFEPERHMFCIEDIAHALSNQPRFGGHLPRWYSVGMHVLNVMNLAPVDQQFDALMHDCSEAYLIDIPKPIKDMLPDYLALEERLSRFLAQGFGFTWPLHEKVKAADRRMLELEWQYVMLGLGEIQYSDWTNDKVKREIIRVFHKLSAA